MLPHSCRLSPQTTVTGRFPAPAPDPMPCNPPLPAGICQRSINPVAASATSPAYAMASTIAFNAVRDMTFLLVLGDPGDGGGSQRELKPHGHGREGASALCIGKAISLFVAGLR